MFYFADFRMIAYVVVNIVIHFHILNITNRDLLCSTNYKIMWWKFSERRQRLTCKEWRACLTDGQVSLQTGIKRAPDGNVELWVVSLFVDSAMMLNVL